MNAKEQIKTFINITTKDIKSHLSTTQKTSFLFLFIQLTALNMGILSSNSLSTTM